MKMENAKWRKIKEIYFSSIKRKGEYDKNDRQKGGKKGMKREILERTNMIHKNRNEVMKDKK